MIRIVIAGGGSIAHAFAAILGARRDTEVVVITRRPAAWSNCLVAHYRSILVAGGVAPTSDWSAVAEAHLVLIAAPAFAHQVIVAQLARYVGTGTWIGSLPAVGRFETLVQTALPAHARILGSLRSPYNARITNYGKAVSITGVVPRLDLVVSRPAMLAEGAELIQGVFEVPVRPLVPFGLAAISPASTIFHPARILELLDQPDASDQRFYGDWGEVAAGAFLQMDDDLGRLRRALGWNVSGLDAQSHYGVDSAPKLAARIRSLDGLPDIGTPFRGGGLDPVHRFVREDLTYGLAVALDIAREAGTSAPAMQETFDRISASLAASN